MSDFDYSKIYIKKGDSAKGFTKTNAAQRVPMSRTQRAKQFAPFDALTGLHARLAKAIEEHKKDAESETLLQVEIEEDS